MTTKILAIEVTLPNPKKARDLAAFIADETVRLSQQTNVESDRSQTESIERMRAEAQNRVRQIETESLKVAEDTPAEGLAEELEALIQAKGLVQRQRLMVRDLHGDLLATLETDNSESSRQDVRNAEKRLDLLEKEMVSLDQQITRKRLELGTRGARREQIDAERQAAWKALEESEARLAHVRSAGGARGERLQVIDSGVIPEKASSPNISLNVLVALILALLGSLLYVTLEFSFQLRRAEARRESLRVASRG